MTAQVPDLKIMPLLESRHHTAGRCSDVTGKKAWRRPFHTTKYGVDLLYQSPGWGE